MKLNLLNRYLFIPGTDQPEKFGIEVKFIKQVPFHPRERLKRKIRLENYTHLNKKSKNEDITFIKQVPLPPRERLKRLEKINKKVDLVNEIGKPKKNTDRMKKINTKKLMIIILIQKKY